MFFGGAAAVVLVLLTVVSTDFLGDAIRCVGLLIALYYGVTAIACAWYFRRRQRGSVRELLTRGVMPFLGGFMMLAAFVRSAYDMFDPACGAVRPSAASGGVFLLGVGSVLAGVVALTVLRGRHIGFFRLGRTAVIRLTVTENRTTMRALAIAAVQTTSVPHDLPASYERFAGRVRAVRQAFPHVQLVVVPELMLSTEAPLLPDSGAWLTEAACAVPGALTDRLCALARETGLWLVPGSVYEKADDGRVHNTALAISPNGEIAARYRKVFPWQPYERTAPGDEFVVFDLPGIGRAGLAICYDGSFPQEARQLAWLGAEVIIQPTLTTTRDRERELVCARANAWTNQVHVVNVNAADPAGVGASLMVGPEGIVRHQAGGGEEVLVDVLDLDAVTRVRTYGSAGLDRPWTQLGHYGDRVELPMYGGTFRRAPWQT